MQDKKEVIDNENDHEQENVNPVSGPD